MPWIVSILLGALLQAVGSFIGRAIVALGFGFVEYLGVKALVDTITAEAQGLMNSATAAGIIEWAGFLRIDQHISIVVSAIGVKLLLSGLQGGSFKRMIRK